MPSEDVGSSVRTYSPTHLGQDAGVVSVQCPALPGGQVAVTGWEPGSEGSSGARGQVSRLHGRGGGAGQVGSGAGQPAAEGPCPASQRPPPHPRWPGPGVLSAHPSPARRRGTGRREDAAGPTLEGAPARARPPPAGHSQHCESPSALDTNTGLWQAGGVEGQAWGPVLSASLSGVKALGHTCYLEPGQVS